MNRIIAQGAIAAFVTLLAGLPRAANAELLYVADPYGVVRLDTRTKDYADTDYFTHGYTFSTPIGLAFGPDGNLYSNDLDNGEIVKFNGNTGDYQRTVVSNVFGGPLTVGPDGTLYEADTYATGQFVNGHFVVIDPTRGHILGYDGQTGALKSNYRGIVGGRFGDLRFGPDHNLYVTDSAKNDIERFDGQTGAALGVFTMGGDLQNPFGLDFGLDGNLYVTSRDNHEILRYNGTTGAYMDVFASGEGLSFPDYALFGPDHDLYVADFGTNQISRFNGLTGAYDLFFAGEVGPLAFTPVPEPGVSALLVGLGVAGIGLLRRRRSAVV